MSNPTPKTDTIFALMQTLSMAEQRQVAAFTKRMWASDLPSTDIPMLKAFIGVLREERRKHLDGDGFDFIEAQP